MNPSAPSGHAVGRNRPVIFTDHWDSTPHPSGPDTKPFKLLRQTLDDRDRYNLVHLSGNFALHGGRHEPVN